MRDDWRPPDELASNFQLSSEISAREQVIVAA